MKEEKTINVDEVLQHMKDHAKPYETIEEGDGMLIAAEPIKQ